MKTSKTRVCLPYTLGQAMQRLHERFATGTYLHDAGSWIYLVHWQYFRTRCTDSSSPLVVMVELTHSRHSDHLVPCILRGRNRSARFRNLLLHPLIQSCPVEVHFILIEHAACAASHGRSTGGQGMLVAHSSKSVRRWHWHVVHERAL